MKPQAATPAEATPQRPPLLVLPSKPFQPKKPVFSIQYAEWPSGSCVQMSTTSHHGSPRYFNQCSFFGWTYFMMGTTSACLVYNWGKKRITSLNVWFFFWSPHLLHWTIFFFVWRRRRKWDYTTQKSPQRFRWGTKFSVKLSILHFSLGDRTFVAKWISNSSYIFLRESALLSCVQARRRHTVLGLWAIEQSAASDNGPLQTYLPGQAQVTSLESPDRKYAIVASKKAVQQHAKTEAQWGLLLLNIF